MTTIAGIDPSLTSTGMARLTYGAGRWIAETDTRTSKGHRNDTLTERHERIRAISADVLAWSERADLVVVEGPSFGSKGGSPLDRYGLWWRVTGRLIDAETPVVVCPPQTRARFATGQGRADKAAVAAVAARIWPDADITSSDAADALILASLGACLLELPVPFDLTKYRTQAMAAVQTPETLEAAA